MRVASTTYECSCEGTQKPALKHDPVVEVYTSPPGPSPDNKQSTGHVISWRHCVLALTESNLLHGQSASAACTALVNMIS